jgi:hypothetical protein
MIHFSVAFLLTVVIFVSVLMDLDFEVISGCPPASHTYVHFFQWGILFRTLLWLWEYFFYLKKFYLDTSFYHVQVIIMLMKIFTLTAGFYLHFQLDHFICNVEENVYFHDLYVIPDHVWAIFYLMIVFDLAVILSFFIGFFFYGFLYKMNMLKISTKSQ